MILDHITKANNITLGSQISAKDTNPKGLDVFMQ